MKQKLQKNNLIWLGTVVNTHGLKGEVRVLSNTDEPETRFATGNKLIYLNNGVETNLTIRSFRFHKSFILVTFEGINDINDIEYLKGHKIYVEREDEELLVDMIGYEIIDAVLGTIGTVEEIRSIGPVESIITTHNGKSLNIPMVDRFITKVDDDNNQVLVSIPESFIE